jgi:CrcB protein
MIWLAVGVGGGLGALGRYFLNGIVQSRFGLFPAGIFAINVLGCLAIGLLAGFIAASRLQLHETARAFLTAGVLGGFTTFSAYGLDTLILARGGHTALAAGNALGQMVAGLAAVWVGFSLATWRS